MAREKSTKYHAKWNAAEWALTEASHQELEKWATDPDCIEMDACAKAFTVRLAKREAEKVKHEAALATKRRGLADDPFDPRTEVSADARHVASRIVTHLWILFVLLPIATVVMLALVGVVK
ncbi:MAG: hypothetical protein ABSB23_17335 [Bryobacteraceae bacterium]|jgi:hypothetical protein